MVRNLTIAPDDMPLNGQEQLQLRNLKLCYLQGSSSLYNGKPLPIFLYVKGFGPDFCTIKRDGVALPLDVGPVCEELVVP